VPGREGLTRGKPACFVPGMQRAIVVPARLGSSRFPRKLLHPVRGVPLVLHTARRLRAACPEIPLVFAVAEAELEEVLAAEDFSCVRTDPALASGTDRIAAANEQLGAEAIVNVQGDEPLVTGEQVRQLFACLESGAGMATLAFPLRDPHRFRDPHQVKVVVGAGGEALYFSRAPIPWFRECGGEPGAGELAAGPVLGHLGLYAYRADCLRRFVGWEPSPLERCEKLEQLRALEHGERIAVARTETPTVGVDHPDDLARLEEALDKAG